MKILVEDSILFSAVS